MRRRPHLPRGCFSRGLDKVNQPLIRRMLKTKLYRIGSRQCRRLVNQRLKREVLLPLSRSAHNKTTHTHNR